MPRTQFNRVTVLLEVFSFVSHHVNACSLCLESLLLWKVDADAPTLPLSSFSLETGSHLVAPSGPQLTM